MIFILNKQEKVINILKNGGGADGASPFFDDTFSQDLATGSETYTFTTIASNDVSRDLVIGNYVAFKEDDEYKLFQIVQTEESHEDTVYITAYCESAGLELINKVFRGLSMPSTSLRRFMETVLNDTGWNVGFIPMSAQESLDLELEDASVYSLLQSTLPKYGVELAFRCEINQGRISSKYVDLYTQRGRVTGKRFTFGRDIEGIKRTVDSTELFTALIGKGNNGVNFRDIQVDGIEKPIGQDFVFDQESYDRYNNNGYHIMGVYKFDTNSPEELLRETYKQLQKVKEPKIKYDVSVVLLAELLGESWDKVRIGDTVGIVDNSFNPPIHLMARVSKLDRSRTNNQSGTCTLANYIEVSSNITNEMRELANELENAVNGRFPIDSEDIKDDAIKSEHIYKDSISTEHLKADIIETKHLKADAITADKIQADAITADHIKGTVVEAINLNATNAVIDSAKIGDLDASKITSGSISAGAIQGNVIEAINMSVSGKISAEKIDVNSLVVDEIDAGKITSGYLNSARIEAGSITADKVTIGDMTNICRLNPDLEAYRGKNEVELLSAINKLCFKKSGSNYTGINFAKTYVLDFEVGDEYVFDHFFYCTEDISVTTFIRYYYTDGTYSNAGKTIFKPTIDTIEQRKTTVKVTVAPTEGKTVKEIAFSLEKNNVPGTFYIRDMKLYKKGSGKLIVNGSITADNIATGAINADKIHSGAITTDKLDAGSVTAEKIAAGAINADKIAAGTITADKLLIGSGKNLVNNPLFDGFELNKPAPNWSKPENQRIIEINGSVSTKKGMYIESSQTTHVDIAQYIRIPVNVGDSFRVNYDVFCNGQPNHQFGLIIYNKERQAIQYSAVSATKSNVWESVAGNVTIKAEDAAYAMPWVSVRKSEIDMHCIFTNLSIVKKVGTVEIEDGAITAEKIHADAITADHIKGQVIEAINLSASNAKIQSAKIEDLNADKIIAGDIDAERIQAQVISAINSYTGTARIKQAQIETLKVGNANITELDAAKIKTGKLSAERIDTENLSVKGSLISGTIVADKIKGGTFDGNNMTIKNLKADSITAGAITIQGENLIHNSAMKNSLVLPSAVNDLKQWIKGTDNNVIIIEGTTASFEGYNYLKYLTSEKADTYYSSVALSRIPMRPGEKFVFSFYLLVTASETLSNNFGVALDGYDTEEEAITGVTSKAIALKTWKDNTITKGSWTRYVIEFEVPNTTAWANVTYGNVRPRLQGNGAIRIAKPMLSRGSIASVFKEHNDELITNGSIDNDKIGDSAITSNKLNIDELFVGENAFIKQLQALEINAEQITVNKIKGSQIDIEGFIKFEHMSDELSDNFIAPTDGSGTWINGGKIFTGSIKADSIDIRGLTVRDRTEEPTFVIDKDGEVAIKGNVQSTNWNEKKKRGYRISKDGEATFNKATINGEILLPNAGITNYGGGAGSNIFRNSNFALTQKVPESTNWDKTLNGDLSANYWNTYNSGVPEATKGYHAHIDNKSFSMNTMAFINLNSKYNHPKRWMAATQVINRTKLKANTKYTFSIDIFCDIPEFRVHGGLYHKITGSADSNFSSGSFSFIIDEQETGRWIRKSWTFTTHGSIDLTKDPTWYVYGYNGAEGKCWVKNLKLEEGEYDNDWSVEDALLGENVRFWAGTSYENRDKAPFRVLQDGSVFASKGIFDGTFTGKLNIGNIYIEDTNTTNGAILVKTNNDTADKIKLSVDESFIDTPFFLGSVSDKRLAFYKESNMIILNNTILKHNGQMTTTSFEYGDGAFGGMNAKGKNGGHHVLRHSADRTYCFDSEGERGDRGDFTFIRKNGGERVQVRVQGSLNVDDKITSTTHGIEMRNTSTGFAFYAT